MSDSQINCEKYVQFRRSHKARHLLTISVTGNAQLQISRYRCPADCSRSVVDNAEMTCHADSCRHGRRRRQSQHASHTVLLSQHLHNHTNTILYISSLSYVTSCPKNELEEILDEYCSQAK